MRYDGIVIGGGAAGMFAAITAAKRGQNVLLLEKNDRLGRKLLITGKGRCNVTNNCTGQEVLQNVPRNGRFLYSAMTAFPPEKTMAFFEERGCRLKTERGNRVFPVTDKSQSILDCLQSESALVSSVREVLPGKMYFVADTTHKKDAMTVTKEEFLTVMKEAPMPFMTMNSRVLSSMAESEPP